MSKNKFPDTLDAQFRETLGNIYDKYGEKMMKIEGLSEEQIDKNRFFNKLITEHNITDTSIDPNANVQSRNINTIRKEAEKPSDKLASRNKIYMEMREEFGKAVADEFLESAVNGELYEHDSHLSSFMPYCFAFSLKDIAHKGLFFIDEMKAESPKHWDTFNHHVLEFISYATNQMAGATGLPDYLIYSYYFYLIDSEGKTQEEIDYFRNQEFQKFIYNLNQPYLKSGIQSAYTNVSILDTDHIIKFFGNERYPDGSNIRDHLEGIKEFQQQFLDYVGKLRQEKWHTFPVISASLIYKDNEYKDEETAKMVVRHNWKYGFNDVNIMNVAEATSLASCCRLVSNKAELNKNKVFNSIGGSDVNIGSTKVVTLNLVRLAILAEESGEGQFKFMELVREKTELIHKYHFAHRKTLQKLVDKGLLPLYTHGLMSFEDQFATIGVSGVFEAAKVLGGITEDGQGVHYSEKGLKLMEEMFEVITECNEGTIEKYGYMSNVEQIPGESTAVKLNQKDRLYFGNRLVNEILGEDCYIYGNQWIPLKEDTSIFHRINSAKLDEHCGGGAILHINLGTNFNTFEDAWEFTKGIVSKGVGYFSYISLIDICAKDHSFFGDTCPICEGPSVSKGIKIVGYLIKQDSYAKERKQELEERKFYNMQEQ